LARKRARVPAVWLVAFIGKSSGEDRVGTLSGRGETGFPRAHRASPEAAEIEEEFAMLTSRLASVAGFIGAAMLAAASAAPAFAANSHDQVTIRVSVADLNMTREAGAKEALARIRHAAREVCGDSRVSGPVAEQMELRLCVADSVKRAVASANLPTLTAVSQSQHLTEMASATR
jgi:UrcA family protein